MSLPLTPARVGVFPTGANAAGGLSGARRDAFSAITIGADCWIGAAAIVMADVGAGSTIGAGSVVSRPIAPCSVAIGNPARVIKQAVDAAGA